MKKVIPIFLLCIVSLICFVGCTQNYKQKAYKVEYFESGNIEYVTIKLVLDKNIGNNSVLFYQDLAYGTDFNPIFIDNDGIQYSTRVISNNIYGEINSEYFKSCLNNFKHKGDYLLLDVYPGIVSTEEEVTIRDGKFVIYILDDLVAFTEITLEINNKFEDDFDKVNNEVNNYLKKHTTKYTFTF